MVDWLKQIALLNEGNPNPISGRTEYNKKTDSPQTKKEFLPDYLTAIAALRGSWAYRTTTGTTPQAPPGD